MNDYLRSMWEDLNAEHFDGALTEPSDIDWHSMTGEEGIEAFGVYLWRINAICIDERFKFDGHDIRSGDTAASPRLEAVYRLVLHEMIHQAQYQKRLARPGGHGPSFVAEASRVADKLGVEPPTEGTAGQWPDLTGLLIHHGI